jgi:general secretion pathway protein D
MSLEVSTPGPQVNLGGITQPQIGQRRIEHETRLQDGEVNLVAGILQDSDTQSISGYPWLLKIPILKYLFGQEAKQRHESEIVFAITPHIVRALDVTDENERAIDVGTNNNIGLRYKESKPAKAGEASSSSSKPAKGGTRQQSSGTQGNAPANPKSSGN